MPLPRTRRIGVFGGAFDPPHAGHAAIAREAFSAIPLDHLIWVPSYRPPHRKTSDTPFEHRVGMVAALIQGWEGHTVSRIEAALPPPHYALNTLSALAREDADAHPDPDAAEWHWILGSDQWAVFSSWHRSEELLRRAHFWIYSRPGFPVPASLPPTASRLIGAPYGDSSTKWRLQAATAPGGSGASSVEGHLLPAAVSAYIAAHGLYA